MRLLLEYFVERPVEDLIDRCPSLLVQQHRGATEMPVTTLIEGTCVQRLPGVIDQAINHPGRGYATGASSMLPILPGTDAADFRAVLDQIKGQAFLQAFESLKGGGQITEVEGQKATQAIARLDRAQSEAEFVKSLQELRGIVASGLERARRKAGAAGQQTGAQPGGPASRPSLTDIFGN